MRKFLTIFLLVGSSLAIAQSVPAWKNIYRSSAQKDLSLVHTKLEVSFDYARHRMDGKAWLTMTPYFYATDSAILDAKGMFLQEVAIMNGTQLKKLNYSYSDSLTLRIKLDRMYNRGEKPVLYISYTARPDEIKVKGSAAIQNAKGLYFINPEGKDSTKPIQIWTQGETEATSVWCPTVDRPDQKTTQEISMTVPAKYVTLSNGLLVKQVNQKNGLRTDTWKMDLPHAPYLMFMGVGDFAIVKDKYKNIPVDYYVEKEYEAVARGIFGLTPEMMGFYSKLLGVEYAWPKYAQMVGRDYVSGAMENTTATLHMERAYQNARELADGNVWEDVIAHELFHHWFGDLVTAESWSNITVNESFADYSEYLWNEHKYGRDKADEVQLNAMTGYLSNPTEKTKDLVRFHYRDQEDIFDLVSYQKGGRILHMLRYELGDNAFFKGLGNYLNSNKFKTGEAHQLRLALEEVSGRDLNPFFNQWYFNSGHPEVTIRYGSKDGQDYVAFAQTQKDRMFELPIKIAAYSGTEKPVLYPFVLRNETDTFFIDNKGKTTFYEADADRVMLWKKDEAKSSDAWIAQYKQMGNFISRKEALTGQMESDTLGENTRQLMLSALKDPYYSIRASAISYFRLYPSQIKSNSDWAVLESLAKTESKRPVRALAIETLARRDGNQYIALFKSATNDSSYSVAGAGLDALIEKDMPAAVALKDKLALDAKGDLAIALDILDIAGRPVSDADDIIAEYKKKPGIKRIEASKGMAIYAAKIEDATTFKKVIGPVTELYKRIPAGFGTFKTDMFAQLQSLLGKKENQLKANPDNTELQAQIDWLSKQLK